jgi:zinc transport system ATP-binding protein
MSTAIEIRDLSFAYGNTLVLDKVQVTLEEGDFLGLIGPNGGGKTTLIRLILGVLEPRIGSITLLGKSPREGRKQAGYIPQEVSSNLAFPISVLDTVLMGLAGKRGVFRSFTGDDRKSAYRILEELNCADLASRQIGALSGGQRQKVLLARAMVAQPRILFLDEPTASIDASGQNEIYEHLKRMNRRGTTVVLTTHNIGAISTYIQSIACVNKHFHFHPEGALDEAAIQATFGCPVDLIAHGIPHRVLHKH